MESKLAEGTELKLRVKKEKKKSCELVPKPTDDVAYDSLALVTNVGGK